MDFASSMMRLENAPGGIEPPYTNDCMSTQALAMAYVPYQPWENIYDSDIALSRGTIFQGLDKPFLGWEAIPRGRK